MYTMIELFSGSGRIAEVFKKHGWNVLTVDYNKRCNADLCLNVYEHLDIEFYKKILGVDKIDFIWASPDCATYSVAAGSKHRFKGGMPKTDYAIYCDNKNNKLIAWLKSLSIPFIVENPRGHFNNMDFVYGLFRYDVVYGAYKGAISLKSTCFFSNISCFEFKKECSFKYKNLKTMNSYKDRCYMPLELLQSIYLQVEVFLRLGVDLISYSRLSIFDFGVEENG